MGQKIDLGKYRNSKKGMVVEVIGMARHSETLEDLVVYTHEGEMWVRPAGMWDELVEVDGKMVKRFLKIS